MPSLIIKNMNIITLETKKLNKIKEIHTYCVRIKAHSKITKHKLFKFVKMKRIQPTHSETLD